LLADAAGDQSEDEDQVGQRNQNHAAQYVSIGKGQQEDNGDRDDF
jgi:hypothetical protein